MFSAKRDKKAAKRFFKKAIRSTHNQNPRVITVDKNPSYPPAIDKLKDENKIPKETKIRQIKYLNSPGYLLSLRDSPCNIVEQDHRGVKRITNPMMGFQSFNTANRTLKGIEAML